ncbi:hypothetical protein [Mycobacterium interjectum]|nr:hypothetical protein [Mycobacterium interjectum]
MKAQAAQRDPQVQVRMLDAVWGNFYDYPDGVQRGDVVSLPELAALRHEHFGLVEPVGAEHETPAEREARVSRTRERVKAWLAAKNAEIERERAEVRNQTIDCATGLPMKAQR